MSYEPCKSYQAGQFTCADGFIHRAYCSGLVGCPTCGHINDKYLPACISDEIPEHFLNEDGSPAYYRAIAAAESAS